MKLKLMTGLLATLLAANTYAAFVPQTAPKGDTGTKLESLLPASTMQKIGLAGKNCLVSLPDANKKTARVARFKGHLAAWIADQSPDLNLPRIYLQRQGDSRVLLVGPAENVDGSMGLGDNLIIKQRESENDRDLTPMGIADKTNEIHWIRLATIDTAGAGLKAFEDGPLDGDRIGKLTFRVKDGRLDKATISHPKPRMDWDGNTITALTIKLGGTMRVFGLCMYD